LAIRNENNLTINQQKFADYYLANGCNATKAYMDTYVKAGEDTAKVNGCRMLKNTYVHEYILKRQAEIQEKTQVTQEYCVMNLKEVVERCLQHKAVMEYNKTSGKYEPTGEFTFDSIGANKALELLGKTLGIYIDKTDNTLNADTGLLSSILSQLGGGTTGIN
jgi:phage terminase small subunit